MSQGREKFIQRSRPIRRLVGPFETFSRSETAGGVLLMLCAAVALAWANSPWQQAYFHLWELEIGLSFAQWSFSQSLHHWINDGLMAIFFFLVGLEIKREMLVGELASWKKSSVPIAAAFGGMVVPASIFAALNLGTPEIRGWGIPMATDIAFALGVLNLLGRRVPVGLKVFLTALAIVDDLGAVLVIALFYSGDLSGWSLAAAGVLVLLLAVGNRAGILTPLFYLVLGAGLWLAIFTSGVHATIAGVLLAFLVPARAFIDVPEFVTKGRLILSRLELAKGSQGLGATVFSSTHQSAVHALQEASEKVQAPLLRFEHALLPWVNFGVLPLFALANAGVTLSGSLAGSFYQPISLGIVLGLFLGKPIGILACSAAAVAAGAGDLPAGVTWRQMLGMGLLGGVGFTMSLFISALAYEGSATLDVSKLAILTASFLSAVAGSAVLRLTAGSGQQPAP